jgi:hypothetical protein
MGDKQKVNTTLVSYCAVMLCAIRSFALLQESDVLEITAWDTKELFL